MADYGTPDAPYPEESLFEQIIAYHKIAPFIPRRTSAYFSFEVVAPVSPYLISGGSLPRNIAGLPPTFGLPGSVTRFGPLYFVPVVGPGSAPERPSFPANGALRLDYDIRISCVYFWKDGGISSPTLAEISADGSLSHSAQLQTDHDGTFIRRNALGNIDPSQSQTFAFSSGAGGGNLGDIPQGWGMTFSYTGGFSDLISYWTCSFSFVYSVVPI